MDLVTTGNQEGKVLVVTSMSNVGYEQYGKEFIDSFLKYWPMESVDLCVYTHSVYPKEQDDTPISDNFYIEVDKKQSFTNVSLDSFPEVTKIKDDFFKYYVTKRSTIDTNNTTEDIVGWKFDVPKFVNKVFALAHANVHSADEGYSWIIWLDADIVTTKKVTKEALQSFLVEGAEVVRLGRTKLPFSETSFVAYNTQSMGARGLIERLINTYMLGEYRFYTEWHDGFIFERLLNSSIFTGLQVANLSPNCDSLDAFGASPLGEYMVHSKGNKKKDGGAVNTATRIPLKYVEIIRSQKKAQQPTQPAKEKEGVNPYIPQGGKLKQSHPMAGPIVINPVDCVSNDVLKGHIRFNLEYIKEWVKPLVKDKKNKVILCSGGPSLKEFIPQIKELIKKKGYKVACVKHAIPTLMDNGIVPDILVVLDPRDVSEESTHGIKRSSLFDRLKGCKTIAFIASMTNQETVKYITEVVGLRVVGWQAYCGELVEIVQELNMYATDMIVPGSCSAVRGIALLEYLGFPEVTLCGFDSSIPTKPVDFEEGKTDSGLQKYFRIWLPHGLDYQPQITAPDKQIPEGAKPIGGRFFWSTGELVALYQDLLGVIPMLIANGKLKVNTLFSTDTLVGEGWRRMMLDKANKEALLKQDVKDLTKNGTFNQNYSV